MKKIHFFLGLYLFLSLISCGKLAPKGNIEVQKVKISEYNQLNLEGKFRAFYVRSDSNFVEVETYPNIFKNLKINISNKILNIAENKKTKNVDFYEVTIYSQYNSSTISISDSVEMNISSEIKTDDFRLNLKNNGKFIGSVTSQRAEVEMYDLSLANFRGKTKNATLKITDTANIIAPYWYIENLNIDAKNGTFAEMNVKDSLKGSITNTAKFWYYNNPVRAFKIEEKADVQNKKL